MGWGVLGHHSYLFFQMAFAAVSIMCFPVTVQLLDSSGTKLGAAFTECREAGLTLEAGDTLTQRQLQSDLSQV